MPDNPRPTPPGGSLPPLPSSGMTGRIKSPTTQLPVKKGGAGKIVVMLSSVAKTAPANTQPLTGVAPVASAVAKGTIADPSQVVRRPPPLPPKQVTPGKAPEPQGRLSATTFVKLPPKTSVPNLASLSGKPIAASESKEPSASKVAPPPLPGKWSEPKKAGPQHIPPIKLNEPEASDDSAAESIFPEAGQAKESQKPEGWKSLEPGELNPPAGSLQSLEVFSRSRKILDKPAPEPPAAEAKSSPLVAPPLLPPTRLATFPQVGKSDPLVSPPPLPSALQVAPPMLEKSPDSSADKLAQPNQPPENRKSETTPESPAMHKVPAMIQPDTSTPTRPPQAVPAKPKTSPLAKITGSWMKKTTPLVLSSTSKVEIPRPAEAKPAVKPAVLPRRLQPVPKEAEPETREPAIETPKSSELVAKPDEAAPIALAPPSVEAPGIASAPQLPEPAKPSSAKEAKKEMPEAKVSSGIPPATPPISRKTKAALPPTRVERAKKKRIWETVSFYILLVVTVVALFFGSLHFGRDTRVEGQVIPPPGMTLNNEVWIVTDFSSEASGMAEDLAAERAPILQEIQEQQDHVQRAQADVAAREERIRLIQQDIQTSKDEIGAIIKQARDDTQKIWDGEGAQIDGEYQAHFNQLKQTIADRAKSLNLKYQPDETYQSPEVWANAYRLALYEVPAGVDSVKEHHWLGDQMKQWRDFLKTPR